MGQNVQQTERREVAKRIGLEKLTPFFVGVFYYRVECWRIDK